MPPGITGQVDARVEGVEEQMDASYPLADLVAAAREGRHDAWDAIVERFMPLVNAVIRRHRLSEADGDDVSQTVWLRLVEHLDALREPAALPGWIKTTVRHECLRVIAVRGRTREVDPMGSDDGPSRLDAVTDDLAGVELEELERRQALREALAELPASRRDLLLLLLTDPPVPYAEISSRLGIPVGSIGPTRQRALEQLRTTPALRRLGADLVGGVS